MSLKVALISFILLTTTDITSQTFIREQEGCLDASQVLTAREIFLDSIPPEIRERFVSLKVICNEVEFD